MTNEPLWGRRLTSAVPTLAILIAVYFLSSAAHLYLLRNSFRFPNISSDEVQFALTGENIRLGHGYTLRGQFNSTLPPIFPLFIALAHSAGPDPRAAMFVFSCVLMCSVVFPVYSLGKLIGLDKGDAVILAAAASLLPHTFYASTYMSEIVQYPAFLAVFCLAIRWLDDRNWMWDVAMGCGMGFLLLTKLQGSQFAGAFVIAGVIVALGPRRWRGGSSEHFAAHFGVVLMITAAIEGAWTLYKSAHSGTALGQYGRILTEQGLPFWTPRLTVAYVADFLLAPGLITAVLLFYWFRYNGNRARTVFVLAIFLVQIIAVSTLDGGLTGWLRERLFMYALPITAVLSAKGLTYFKQRQTFTAQCALFAVPAMLIGAVLIYPFAVSSVIEVPWANAMGTLAGLLPFSRACLSVASVILTAVAALVLVRSSKHAVLLFGGFLTLFYGVGFASSSVALGRWTASGLASVSPIMRWLAANQVRGGDRLLTAGRHAFFEDPALRAAPVDNMFLDWTWRNGLGEDVEWQIETIGRFDVRMIPTAKAIPTEARPNDFVLTVARLDALGVPSSHDFLQLYRVGRISAQAPAPKYLIHIPAARFRTAQVRQESGAKTTSSLVYAPPLGLAGGTYQVRLDTAASTNDPLTVEVTGREERVLLRETAGLAVASASFSQYTGPVAFHVFGDIGSISRFEGLDVEWVSNSPPPAEPPNGFVPEGAFTNTEPSDLLHARSHSGSACYIDLINSAPPAHLISVDQQKGASIEGWAASTDDHAAAEKVYLELSSTSGRHYWIKAQRHIRPDVANALGNPALSDAGFTVSADLRLVTPSVYRVTIVLLNGEYARECDPDRELNVQ
jgi:hypothetical protein